MSISTDINVINPGVPTKNDMSVINPDLPAKTVQCFKNN